eukprot:gene6311-6791_t
MEGDMSMLPDPQMVKERIEQNLETLQNLSSSNRSRSDILIELSKDLSDYYGYLPELTDLLLNLFSPAECREYMEASDHPRPLVIRTNTLKTTRKDLLEALSKRGAAVEAIDWSKVAVKVTESSVPIGATPEYLGGHYMLQSASSLNPVMALDPRPGEKILDMSAAPGGKTTYIAQLMKNSGTVVANDLKAERQKATIANLHRLGVKNAIVCNYDGRQIPKVFKGFDRVLLDAPCSGLGIIARDQSVKLQRSIKDIERVAHLQKELLRAAIDTVDANSPTGGIIVYSTCSISVEENEQVIQYILQKRYVKVIDTGLQVGKPGLTRYMQHRFHPSIANTRRFYPHVHNMDGFYVAKLKKYANGVRGEGDEVKEEDDEDNEEMDVDEDEEEGDEHSVTTEEEEEEVEPPKKSNNKKQQQQQEAQNNKQRKTSEPEPEGKYKKVVEEPVKKTSSKDKSVTPVEKVVVEADSKKKKKRDLEPVVEQTEEEEPVKETKKKQKTETVDEQPKKKGKKAKQQKEEEEENEQQEESNAEENEAHYEDVLSDDQKQMIKEQILQHLIQQGGAGSGASSKKRKPLRAPLRK